MNVHPSEMFKGVLILSSQEEYGNPNALCHETQKVILRKK